MRPYGCTWTLRGHIQEPSGINQQLISKLEGEAKAESREVCTCLKEEPAQAVWQVSMEATLQQ